jgi:hypothetical protein
MRYELIVSINGENKLLDTQIDDTIQASVSLNFNIADVSDISSKNSSYSKEITLPDTKNNRAVFEYIFSVNSDSSFDATKISRCWVIKDTVTQFEGNLQLTAINYDYENNIYSYTVVIYADNRTLFTSIGEKFLTDLNLSQYNHIYGPTAAITSWNSNYTNGYYYPLMDYSGNMTYPPVTSSASGLNIIDFYPGFYLKPLVDQIFIEAGYSYTSDFLNSEPYTKFFLPFNNAQLFSNQNINIITENNLIFEVNPGTTVSVISGSRSGGIEWVSFGADNIIYDPNNFYDTTNHFYNNYNTNILFAQRFGIDIDITADGGSGTVIPGTPWTNTLDDILVIVARQFRLGTTTPVTGWTDTPSLIELFDNYEYLTFSGYDQYSIANALYSGLLTSTHLSGSLYRITGTIYTDYTSTYPLQPNEQVRFFLSRYNFTPSNNPNTNITDNTKIFGEINPYTLVNNSYIGPSTTLPNNVKQKDLLSSIINMFNLYIEPSKDDSTNFIIEPRSEYYSKYQKIKDWSEKLDISQPIISEVLSNSQLRSNLFTYIADKDYYNSSYTTNTKQIYGQYEWIINNDFITGQNIIQPIFSPTPIDLLTKSTQMYLATIVDNNNSTNAVAYAGMNIRLLYANVISLYTDTFIFDGVAYNYYPYAGPFDNPLNPNYSLNFGQVPAFYPNFIDTVNNLFYNYWQDYMLEISDKNNRIITAYFYLTSNDISDFKFSDLIFFRIDGNEGYYRVNMISDFDPSLDVPTQVQLIKAYNYNIT